jgi:error-prone DNA polymerase
MERYRRTVIGSTLLGVEGKIQRQDNIIHVIAEKLYDVSFQLACLTKTKIERREDDPLMKKNARAQKKIRSRNFY